MILMEHSLNHLYNHWSIRISPPNIIWAEKKDTVTSNHDVFTQGLKNKPCPLLMIPHPSMWSAPNIIQPLTLSVASPVSQFKWQDHPKQMLLLLTTFHHKINSLTQCYIHVDTISWSYCITAILEVGEVSEL